MQKHNVMLTPLILGGVDADALVGGTGADLLVGNAGTDLLQGGQGNDTLLGGTGNDAYVYATGDGLDTILDTSGQNTLAVDGSILAGGDQYGDARVHKDANGHLYVQADPKTLLIDGNIVIQNYGTGGTFGLTMNGAAADINPATTHDIKGDPLIHTATITPGGEGSDWRITNSYGQTYDSQGNLTSYTADYYLVDADGYPTEGGQQERADTLHDTTASDHIISGGGNDIIYSSGGSDLIEAGAGRDIVHAESSTGNNVIAGGADGDILIGGTGNDRLYADAQIDAATAIANGNTDASINTQGDWLTGGDGNDTLVGSSANDVLSGGGGSDLLIGGAGNDDILGDANYIAQSLNWTVTDTNGTRLFQPATGETTAADGAADVIYAGSGNDHAWGGLGNDVIFGEGGNDQLSGNEGNDILSGGTGSDTMSGGTGSDTFLYNQGDGEDWINDTVNPTDLNVIHFGQGITAGQIKLTGYLKLDLGSGDIIHINNFSAINKATDCSIQRFEFADGTALTAAELLKRGFDLTAQAGETAIGSDYGDRLSGGNGSTLAGMGGNDTYQYSRGNGEIHIADNLDGGQTNTLRFAAGISASDITLSLGSLKLDLGNGDTIHIDGILQDDVANTSSIQRFEFADGSALSLTDLLAKGFDLNGTAGDDQIIGTNLTDRINGLAGNDTLTGGAGDDVLAGGTGNDVLIGGTGSDTYLFNRGDGQDIIADGGDPSTGSGQVFTDTLQFATDILQGDISIRRTPAGDLELSLNNSTDQIIVQGWYAGQADANRIERIVFGDGSTLTSADFENLPITGTEGDDIITGTGGNDTIIGLGGNDTLDGGAGNDTLIGGDGLDTYRFGFGMGKDTVVDASLGGNTIELQAGMSFNDLRATQSGNDLLLSIRGTDQGMLLQDYYLTPQDWALRDAGGTQQTMGDFLNQAAQDEFSALRDDFFAATKSQLAQTYSWMGYQWQADGSLAQPLVGSSVSKTAEQSTSTTTSTWHWFNNQYPDSTSTNTSTNIGTTYSTPLSGAYGGYPVLSGNQAAFDNSATNTDAAVLNDYSSGVTSTYSAQWVNAQINWQSPYNVNSTSYEIPGFSWINGFDPVTGQYGAVGSVSYLTQTVVNRSTQDGLIAAIYPYGTNPSSTTAAWLTKYSATYDFKEIAGGASDNTISTWNPYAVINGGAGNDTLQGGGLLYGGEGNDVLYGGTLQYGGNGNDSLMYGDTLNGGAGDDTLTAGNVLIGGAGNDTMDGGSYGTGETRYLIDPAQTGVGLIGDTGDSEQAYMDWYFGSRGVTDVQESAQYGGMYAVDGEFSQIPSFLLGGGYRFYYTPDQFPAIQAEAPSLAAYIQNNPQLVSYIEPLPPFTRPAANDYAALQSAYDAGAIPMDTVEFAAGIALADLSLSWGQEAGRATLDLSWNNGASQVRLVLPSEYDTLGFGVEQVKFADGSVIGMQDLIALAPPMYLVGTEDADILSGNIGNDTIIGLGGDDQLYGDAGNDVLNGGAGNDTLAGGSGSDTYVFDIGHGVDTIIDNAGEGNTLVFGAGVDPASVTLSLGSLLIKTGNPSTGSGQVQDAIHIQGFDPNNIWAAPVIESFQFAPSTGSGQAGTTLSYAQLLERGFDITGTAADDVLTGTNTTDRISGGAGNDTLDGGAGNDVLMGGAGSDTYIFGADSGQDAIVEAFNPLDLGAVDKVVFGAGVALSDLRVSRGGADNNDLSISISGSDAALTIQGWFNPATLSTVSQFTFADGTSLGAAAMAEMAVNHAPTVMNPIVDQSVMEGQAFSFVATSNITTDSFMSDTTDMGTLNQVSPSYDSFVGGGIGNDTFSFARGDGNVYFYDWDSTVGNVDTVQLAAGIAPSDISINQDQWGTVTLSVNSTSDSLTLSNWLYSNDYKIEQLVFADGTVWGVSDIQSRLSISSTTGNDYITGTSGDDAIHALSGDDAVLAGSGNDTVLAGAGNDWVEGEGGSDLLSGGSGADEIYADSSYSDTANDLLNGGAGDDYLDASISNDLLIGGQGNDYVFGNDGKNVMLFNRGDGNDNVDTWSSNGVASRSDTLSLGGGISYADLSFRQEWGNLVLDVGNGESISIANWFGQSGNSKVITRLQIVAEVMAGFDPNSSDTLLNKRVQQFDFVGLANQFEAALAADPTITTWQLAPHLADFSLGGSDTQAIGGDMAYLYGKNGNLNGLSEAELRTQLTDAQFGTSAQTLTKTSNNVFADADTIHGDMLTYSATLADGSALPAWLNFDAATQTFSGTPDHSAVGNLNVSVIATDTGGLSATSAFKLDVTGIAALNSAPMLVNPLSDQSTLEDSTFTSTIPVGTFSDADFVSGDTLSYAATLADPSASSGQAPLPAWLNFDTATQTFSGAPGNADVGNLNLLVTATDSGGLSVASNFTLNVINVNDPPTANADVGAATEDGGAVQMSAATLLANDTDPDTIHGDALNIAGVSQAASGAVVSLLNGDVQYDAGSLFQSLAAGQTTTDTFSYTIADTAGAASAADVTMTIIGVNDAPVTVVDTAAVQEDLSITVTGNVLTNDSDVDQGTVLSVANAGVFTGSYGSLTLLADGSYSYALDNTSLSVQSLAAGQIVTETFAYQATDGIATTPATLMVSINGTNDAPVVATPIADQQTNEDAPFSFTIPAGTFDDVDFIHGDTLTYSATLADGLALPPWLTFDAAAGTFSGIPTNWDVGNLNVAMTATDTGGLSASSNFALNVINVNDTPTANADTGAATEDGGAALLDAATLLANDTDPDFIHGDALNIVGVSQAASGTAVSLMNGVVQYDIGTLFQSLAQGQTATDTFSYTVDDMAGATSIAQVTMTVTGVNDGPVTVNDAAAVQEDFALVVTGNVLANDSDVDQGTVLSVANAGTLQGNYGSLMLNADGNYSYALGNTSAAVQGLMAGQTVTETFAYQATDGIAATPATLTVTITGSNDAPVAQNDVATVNEDSLLSIQSDALLANDTDADIGDTKALVGVDALSALGSSVSLVNGQVVYDHGGQFNSLMAGQSVVDSFSYTMADSAGAASTATVNVTVTGVNDGPQANGDSATMGEDTPQTTLTAANLLFNDTDPDTGDVVSIAGFDAVAALGNAVSMDAAGNLVFDIGSRYQYLAQGETLTDTFNYSITDTAGATSTAQVNMTIAGLNDAPVAVADVVYAQEDLNITVTGNVLANDTDVDQSTVLSVANAGVFAGNYGQLTLAADGSYSYALDNASMSVQSLGRTAQAVEHFGYTATDGMVGASSVLDVFLNGANDAPILVAPLADQDFTFNKHFSWQMPEGSFTDIDQGDTLGYAATLADGSALPDWLSFDAATRTFSGETPKEVGFVDVQVIATDKVAATGSTAGSLSASDVFRISVSHGNEGVGNGKDAPPPGHGRNTNDGGGTAPGRPGSKGGNGHPAASDGTTSHPTKLANNASQVAGYAAHPQEQQPHDRSLDAGKHKDDTPTQDTGSSDSSRTDKLISSWFNEESSSERYSSFSALDWHGDRGDQIDRQVSRNVARGISGDVSLEWARMEAQLKKHLEQTGGDEGIFADYGTGARPFGLYGSGGSQNVAQLGMGSGQQLKTLTGLKEGLERLGG